MNLTADQITIAVTVFDRRQYVLQSIASALNQTAPVRVIVVEDCSPDTTLREFVRKEFGERVDYFRNPSRRGLFGNWNACLECCRTPWLSILHDDDYLSSGFIEAILELNRKAPDRGLYFGQTQIVNQAGQPQLLGMRPALAVPWRSVELTMTIDITPFPFPGNLFRVDLARAAGGFRETSQYCGDWEMWCRLIAFHGAAETRVTVACNRSHGGPERGTSKIVRNGRLRPLTFVQQKRILRLLRERGSEARFDRSGFLRKSPMSIIYLLRFGPGLTPRLRRYHLGLLLSSKAPGWSYGLFQTAARFFGVKFLNAACWIWRLLGSPLAVALRSLKRDSIIASDTK